MRGLEIALIVEKDVRAPLAFLQVFTPFALVLAIARRRLPTVESFDELRELWGFLLLCRGVSLSLSLCLKGRLCTRPSRSTLLRRRVPGEESCRGYQSVFLQEHFEKLKTAQQGGRISGSKVRRERSCKRRSLLVTSY